MLKKCKKSGGGVALSMGYNDGNGHVNYLQDWGTPKIAGVGIDSLDLARCHMNQKKSLLLALHGIMIESSVTKWIFKKWQKV